MSAGRDSRALDLADEMASEHGYWGEHPDHSPAEWRLAVANEETRLGYWDWVADQIEESPDYDPSASAPPCLECRRPLPPDRVRYCLDCCDRIIAVDEDDE